jgi:sialic acid synthase SpsE
MKFAQLSKKKRPFLIAEIGSNHNGSMKLAKRMIISAKKSGADAVKFQTFTVSSLFSKIVFHKNEILKKEVEKYSLREKDIIFLSKLCKKNKIIFCATPFSNNEADFLINKIKVPFIKIASMDLNNYPFVEYLAKKKIPLLLSTGFASIKEIETAILIIRKYHKKIALLHCVAEYPPSDQILNLKKIEKLKKKFSVPIGFSDHTIGTSISLAAVALGAVIIEKHFTTNKKLKGWDHSISADPAEFSFISKESKKVFKAIENREFEVVESNKKKLIFRRSIVASRNIYKGEIINSSMISFKRPGTGIPPSEISSVIGKKVKRNIEFDTLIKKQDF